MPPIKRTMAERTMAKRTAANRTAPNKTAARPPGRRLAEGLGALALLGMGLVGIPVLLAAMVGWPLPHQVPTGSQITHAMGTSIPDSFWPHLFAALAWLAWAYFAVSVVINLVAQLRGRRRSRHLRLFSSSAVGALIAAVMVLGQLRGPVLSASGSPVAPLPVVHLVAATAPATVPATTPAITAQPAAVTHTVVEGDTLWGIATQYYGDGTQWQAVYQANVGVPQPGGGALSDAHWIYPGWTLIIPAVTGAQPATSSTPVAPTPSIPASAPPPAPAPAPALSPTVAIPTTSPATTQPTPVAHGSTKHRAVTQRTDGRQHPPTASVTATGAAAKPPSGEPQPVRNGGPASHPVGGAGSTARPHTATHGSGDELATVAIGAGIFGLAAVGLVAALDRRRRRQSGRRARGRHIPRPKPNTPLADLELELRHYAQAGRALRLDQLAELLGQASAGGGVSVPEVLAVQVRPDALDVIVAAGSDVPPPPFESVPGSPATWRLSNAFDSHVMGDAASIDDPDVPESIPLVLATVGQGAAGTLLVNLEHYRTVHIDVDADLVPGTLATMATELAGVTGVGAAAVIAVGFGWGVVDRMENGIVIDDLGALLERPQPEETTIVLVDAGTVTETMIERLHGAPGLRLVLVGPDAPDGSDLRIDPAQPFFDGGHLSPTEPPHVLPETFTEIQTLLDLADVIPVAEPEQPCLTASDESGFNGSGSNRSAHPRHDVLTGPVTIGLLGEPTIAVGDNHSQSLLEAVAGTAGTKARRVEELLVYLAAHDGTAGRGQWLTDISPDKALSDGYIRNLVLLTRRSLEAITGDPDLLGYERTSQRLTLGTRVSTDWSLFQALIADHEPEGLRSALSLVRTTPFGANPEPWTSAGGISYVMADSIADAAIALGEHALSIGDPGLAVWAARQGQLANRYDQNLWRILLRAATDRPGLQRVWDELHALLAVDGEPTDDLDPATVGLFNSLNSATSQSAKPRTAKVVVLQDDDDAVLPTRQAV